MVPKTYDNSKITSTIIIVFSCIDCNRDYTLYIDKGRIFYKEKCYFKWFEKCSKNGRVGAIIKRFNSPGLIGWDLEILEALGPIS